MLDTHLVQTGHMHTKYEVSMSNPVPGGGVHRHSANDDDARRTKHDNIRLFG